MIDKLKAVLKEYQDEPCLNIKCHECKFNIIIYDLYEDTGEDVRLCDVLDRLSEGLEVD